MGGKPITVRSVGQAVAHGIGYATEDRKRDGLALNLDVQYNINMAHLRQLSRYGFIRDKEGARNAAKYRGLLRIKTPSLRQRLRNLSGGNQQKVILAKWLCNDVKVLIIDEPTRGIDVGAKLEVYELLNRLSDQGVAIIMISSELPEILGMSDRVLVIHAGAVNGELDAKKTTQEEILYLAAGYNKLEGRAPPSRPRARKAARVFPLPICAPQTQRQKERIAWKTYKATSPGARWACLTTGASRPKKRSFPGWR